MATELNKQDAPKIRDEQPRFNAEDWQMFFAMQENPSEPTERMKKAILTYNKIIAVGES
jgi:uncharacterized protein (DUF1778 family)